MPRARRRSKPAEKSAEAPTDSTAIVQAEVAGQVNSCGGTQGNPTTGGQRTMQDQVNLQSGLKSKEECIQKEEFASKNHSEEGVEKDEETNVEKIIEKLKMGSEEDKKTAALLEERHRQRVGGAGLNLGGSATMPAQAKRKGKKPVFASTPAADMRAFLPMKLKKQANAAATVTGNGSTAAGTSSASGTGSGKKAQPRKAPASSSGGSTSK